MKIIKIRAEIKQTRKTIEKYHKPKTWYFERLKKIDKPSVGQEKREKPQINKFRNETKTL